jgi:hypothetical protein
MGLWRIKKEEDGAQWCAVTSTAWGGGAHVGCVLAWTKTTQGFLGSVPRLEETHQVERDRLGWALSRYFSKTFLK